MPHEQRHDRRGDDDVLEKQDGPRGRDRDAAVLVGERRDRRLEGQPHDEAGEHRPDEKSFARPECRRRALDPSERNAGHRDCPRGIAGPSLASSTSDCRAGETGARAARIARRPASME